MPWSAIKYKNQTSQKLGYKNQDLGKESQSSWMMSNMIKLLILTLAAAALGAPSASETKRPKEALRLRFEPVLGPSLERGLCPRNKYSTFKLSPVTDARYLDNLERDEKSAIRTRRVEKRDVLGSFEGLCPRY